MDSNILSSLLPLVVIIVIFYFLLIRAQKQAAAKRAEMLNAIKSGDKVETVSRVFGTVVSVNGENLILNIGRGQSLEIEIHKEGVARVITDDASSEQKAA